MSQSLPDLPTTCRGGCHCGAVRFEVTLRKLEALDCNCTICSRKGFLHLIVPATDFHLVQGEQSLSTYQFGTQVAQHHFCRHCGIHSFYRPRSHPDGFSVNLRCLDDDWVRKFKIKPFEGRNWEQNIRQIRGYK